MLRLIKQRYACKYYYKAYEPAYRDFIEACDGEICGSNLQRYCKDICTKYKPCRTTWKSINEEVM